MYVQIKAPFLGANSKVIPNLNLLNIPICCILNICGKMLFSAKTFLHKHIIPAEKSVVYMNMFEFNTQWTHHNIYLLYLLVCRTLYRNVFFFRLSKVQQPCICRFLYFTQPIHTLEIKFLMISKLDKDIEQTRVTILKTIFY